MADSSSRRSLERFAQALKAARKRKRLRQEQLAVSLGVSIRRLTSWERGERVPLLPEVVRLSFALREDLLLPYLQDELERQGLLLAFTEDHPLVAEPTESAKKAGASAPVSSSSPLFTPTSALVEQLLAPGSPPPQAQADASGQLLQSAHPLAEMLTWSASQPPHQSANAAMRVGQRTAGEGGALDAAQPGHLQQLFWILGCFQTDPTLIAVTADFLRQLVGGSETAP